jgi:hypothetical protein
MIVKRLFNGGKLLLRKFGQYIPPQKTKLLAAHPGEKDTIVNLLPLMAP